MRFVHEPFQVGDAELMEPRDPNGPPEETYNCRCTREEYSLSDLPKDLLAQVEHRLTEEQRLLIRGVRVADASFPFPPNPGGDFIKKVLDAENKLNSGGIINDLTPFEALVHFLMGTGNDITVSINQVAKGIDFVRDDSDKKLIRELAKIKASGQSSNTIPVQIRGMSITVDFDLFGRVEFDISGSIFATKAGWRVIGDISAQTDTYDFNKSNRSFLAEAIVAVMRTIGKIAKAKPFDIHFDGSKKRTVSGNWKEVP